MADQSDTTTDAFLGGALMLRQPKLGYRAGIDPVLLAAACSARAGERVLDCGAGVGTVGLCVARRVAGCEVVLVERDDMYAHLAAENIAANGLSDRVRVITADVTAPPTPALRTLLGTVDHALANPPYHLETDGTRSGNGAKDAANVMPADALDSWARFLVAALKPRGTVTFIHRADALDRLFAVMQRRFGGIVVTPLQSSARTDAIRVIVSGIKGSRAPLTLRAALVVHDASGGYTSDIDAVLRAPIALARQAAQNSS